MGRLGRLLALGPPDRALLVRALTWMALARLSLAVSPFTTVLRLFRRLGTPPSPRADREPASIDRILWAVDAAARHLPGEHTCLPRALVADALLVRHGYPARLRIGVRRGPGEPFEAHAWVELGDEVVMGSIEDLDRFEPLLAWGAGVP